MDHLGRALERHALFSTQDTFWSSLAYRVYESETSKHVQLVRKKVLLYFASLIFGESLESFDAFDVRIRALVPCPKNVSCYRHPAVQMWIYQLRKNKVFNHTVDEEILVSDDIRDLQLDTIRDEAIHFVRTNNRPGNCTCRYTLGYLFASVYGYDVYLKDDTRKGRIDVLQPYQGPSTCIDVTLVDCALSDVEIQRGKEEFYVYITYTGKSFELWLPQIVMSANWLLKGASTRHVTASAYKLVQVNSDAVKEVGLFEKKGHVYYCLVNAAEFGNGIYRVVPGVSSKFAVDTPIYIYTSRAAEREDACTLVGYVDAEGNPAAFILNPAETRMVIVVYGVDQTRAERYIAEELKLKVIALAA